MELKIPVCALKGLELADIKFNDELNCDSQAVRVGNHFTWNINYNECGTTKTVSCIFRIEPQFMQVTFDEPAETFS